MDFELSPEQVELQTTIRSLCEGRFDIEFVRSLEGTGVDRPRWRELAEAGVFSIGLSEEQGGLGLGWADTALVFEELGRAAIPGPLVGTALAAGLVDGAATGEKVVGVVERASVPSAPTVVEYADQLDALLILDDHGVSVADGSKLSPEMSRLPLDAWTPVGKVSLPDADRVGGPDLAESLRVRGGVLTSALQLGLAQGALALAVAYAKERQQFGKPIGTFQAVKHLCAEMAAGVEVLRAAVYAAGVAIDDPETGDPVHGCSVARILAGAVASQVGADCVQVHGGMGYTWEVDAHIFLKRSWVLDQAFGDGEHHAEEVAAGL